MAGSGAPGHEHGHAHGHTHPSAAAGPEDVADRVRAGGGRMTEQRQRVYAAVAAGAHATPDAVLERVGADGGRPMPASTVYRALEALEAAGLVEHSHLDHRAPTYHLAGHATHIHLLCRVCGTVTECDAALAEGFSGNVRAATGFAPDMTHMAVHGTCAACLASAAAPGPAASVGQEAPA